MSQPEPSPTRPRHLPPLPAERLVRRGLGLRGGPQPAAEDGRRTGRSCSTGPRPAAPSRSPTPAGTGWRRCRWASCAATTRSCAATTASATTPTDARPSCRRRTRSTPARRCTPTRWWSGTATCGCGRATRRWPTRTSVPDLYWNDHPEWAGDGKTIHVNCSYQLIVDNLMDLTHEQFVHGSSIGHDSLSESDFEVTHTDRTVTVTKWMLGIDPPPFWKRNLQDRLPRLRRAPSTGGRSSSTRRPSTVAIDVGRGQGRHRRAGRGPQPGRHRHRDQHDDPRDRQHLLLPVGVRPRLVPGQAGDHHAAARGRLERLLRGRGDAGGPAAGHRGQPGLRLLQPQHRRGQHVDPPHRAADDRRGVRPDDRRGDRRRGERRRRDGRGDRGGEREPGTATAGPARAPRSRTGWPGTATQPAAGLMGRGL